MDGLFAFQRRDLLAAASAIVVATINLSTVTSLQVSSFCVMEIANLSTTAAAAFVISPSGASSSTPATTGMRTIPPLAVLYERCQQGVSAVAAMAVSGAPTLVFTPGVQNG